MNGLALLKGVWSAGAALWHALLGGTTPAAARSAMRLIKTSRAICGEVDPSLLLAVRGRAVHKRRQAQPRGRHLHWLRLPAPPPQQQQQS